MKYCYLFCLVICLESIRVMATECGCKQMHICYKRMLQALHRGDEARCVEDSSLGSSTVTIYLKALTEYCPFLINVTSDHVTFDGRRLYEVIIEPKEPKGNVAGRPTIIINAGEEAGTESVGLALYLIQQLTACVEHFEMVDKVRWVIMPSVNPDGQEYARYKTFQASSWRKNCKTSNDELSIGVDISRNFDYQWGSCDQIISGFSPIFPGIFPASENETIFIKDVMEKHKKYAKVYLAIKKNGHHIGYPYAYSKNEPTNIARLQKIAGDVAFRVNQRSNGIHLFTNASIFELEGKAHCGNSVDYALNLGIDLAFEMRVFLGSDNRIMSKFQTMPRGYESSLCNAYISGIRELYSAIIEEKKFRRMN